MLHCITIHPWTCHLFLHSALYHSVLYPLVIPYTLRHGITRSFISCQLLVHLPVYYSALHEAVIPLYHPQMCNLALHGSASHALQPPWEHLDRWAPVIYPSIIICFLYFSISVDSHSPPHPLSSTLLLVIHSRLHEMPQCCWIFHSCCDYHCINQFSACPSCVALPLHLLVLHTPALPTMSVDHSPLHAHLTHSSIC